MSTYSDVVNAAKNYVGFAASLVVDKALKAIKKDQSSLTASDLGTIAGKIAANTGSALTPEKKEALKKDILALK